MLKKTLLAATLLAATGAAQAEFVHNDFYSGDQMVTVDTETGLAWMKFDLTNTYGVYSIEGALAEGEKFEGWSIASYSQVSNLWDSFLISPLSQLMDIALTLSVHSMVLKLQSTGRSKSSWAALKPKRIPIKTLAPLSTTLAHSGKTKVKA